MCLSEKFENIHTQKEKDKPKKKKKKDTRICKWQRYTTNTQIEFYVRGIPFGLHYMYKTSHHPIYTTKTTPFYKTTSCSYKKKPQVHIKIFFKKNLKKRASLHAQSVCDEASMLKFDTDIIIYIYIYTII